MKTDLRLIWVMLSPIGSLRRLADLNEKWLPVWHLMTGRDGTPKYYRPQISESYRGRFSGPNYLGIHLALILLLRIHLLLLKIMFIPRYKKRKLMLQVWSTSSLTGLPGKHFNVISYAIKISNFKLLFFLLSVGTGETQIQDNTWKISFSWYAF